MINKNLHVLLFIISLEFRYKLFLVEYNNCNYKQTIIVAKVKPVELHRILYLFK